MTDANELHERACGPDPVREDETPRQPELVVITGMSGAGRSEAIHTFEDLGYFCIDNLPPQFIRQLVELTALPGSRIDRVAVVCDVRSLSFFGLLADELFNLRESGVQFRLLFLEAEEETLVHRFKETRRPHPLCASGSIIEGIRAEREALSVLRGRADVIIDTSDLMPRELRSLIRERFASPGVRDAFTVSVVSFGYKYGIPIDADIVLDVRFLCNPFYNPRLRPHTGLDQKVRDYVLGDETAREFLDRWFGLLELLIPNYIAEGKSNLSIALGCTGGMHRSVVLVERTAEFLREHGYRVAVSHRDIGKDRERQ